MATSVPSNSSETRLTYQALPDARPEAIVVCCSDPRFQTAFDEFIQKELDLAKGQFMPLIIGGGAGVLGHPEQLPKEFKFLKERFELYREVFPSLRRVVLINHEDCRYYEFLKKKLLGFLGPRFVISPEHARDDLALVSKAFKHVLPHLGFAVEFFYARFADAERSKVLFEKVQL